VTPYYADELVTLYLGDCREVTEWLAADVLVTDPPYGRGWKQGDTCTARGWVSDRRDGIAGDDDATLRDTALMMWGARCAVAFGDPLMPRPPGVKQVLPYLKPPDAGGRGAVGGFRRDFEDVYLIGPWSTGLGGRSSLLRSNARMTGGPGGTAFRHGHPHAKPVDVMETLIAACPDGTVADPFAGSGSTLVAARNLGRKAIGIEVHEPYAEAAARRLSQCVLAL
jgi:site-specific DNA-methyltransferase (adenine-specific)